MTEQIDFVYSIDEAAVSIVRSESDHIKGVIRFSSANTENHSVGCVVDGVIDGLRPGLHGLHIHECGDLSNGSKSIGAHYNPRNTSHGAADSAADKRHAGDLGNIQADDVGQAKFRFIDKLLTVGELIGRSVAVTENADDNGLGSNQRSLVDGNSGEVLACGIIARAAGIFQNFKRICACDGVTIWEERNKPLTGPGRRN